MIRTSIDSLTESDWKGYRRHDFTVSGRPGLLVEPREPAAGRPWVWRAEFFDAFPQADMALLELGWHLAYYRVSDMYGCPEAVELMHGFQCAAEAGFGLAPKAVLFGFSRGGLYAFNYAVRYPKKVSALYLDAPVLDIRSWPGGFGAGSGGKKEWQECLRAYRLTEETAKSFGGNPLNRADDLVNARIPTIVVAGDADTVVPIGENAMILAESCKKMGDDFRLIVKRGVDHHPHSLEDPAPIVGFLLAKTGNRPSVST